MMRAVLLAPIAFAITACGSGPADQASTPDPTVLVGVVRPQQGSLPSVVTAYGSVAPSQIGTRTFSEAQAGQVARLMVAPGSAVRAGQPLATFLTAPTALSTYKQAESALAAALKQRAATTQLLAQQLATTDQLAQADKAVADARSALVALRAERAGTASRTIIAPFDGVVTGVAVAQGDRIQPGAPILTLARAGGIVVTVGIDPAQRDGITVGRPATLKRLSGGKTVAGRVIRVDGALNATTRLLDVDLGFPTGALLPGEGMQVAIETGQVSGWIVPHAAVVTAGGRPRVFQVIGGKAKVVPVALRLSSEGRDVVEGPIDPARPLVVAGAYQVGDGDAVRLGR